jgi:hypothetical protein
MGIAMYGSAHTWLATRYIFSNSEKKRDALIGVVQAKYGIAQEEAEQQVEDWEKAHP